MNYTNLSFAFSIYVYRYGSLYIVLKTPFDNAVINNNIRFCVQLVAARITLINHKWTEKLNNN